MRILSKPILEAFWIAHPDSEGPFKSWYSEASAGTWATPQDIKDRYAHASFVGSNRVVFNIKGNDYRLIASVAYKFDAVYIKFIGTHAEYSKIDVVTVEYSKP